MTSDISTPPQPWWKRLKRWQVILAIVFIGLAVRVWSAWQLPIDADEPVYMKAGQDYANFFKVGNLNGVINYSNNQEHPPLQKLMYSLPFQIFEPYYGSTNEFYFNRMLSVVWGTLAVLILALMDPWAGLFLALDSMVIKYTSQVYLEALPLMAGLIAIYAFQRSLRPGARSRWFWISSMALGLAVSGKYLYGLAVVPIIIMFLTSKKRRFRDFLFYGLAALITFFFLDPYLWADPINRLYQSLFYHLQYTQGSDVLRAGYPWYQPFLWISSSVPWHPTVFFFPTLDLVIFGLAVVGLYDEFRKRIWVVIWIVVCFLVLLVWPTKWPQYTLILIPALCLAASAGLRFCGRLFNEFNNTWHWAQDVLPHPDRLFWGALILVSAVYLGGKVFFEIRLAVDRQGWSQIQSSTSPLISNNIFNVNAANDGRIFIATDEGVAIWKPNNNSPWGENPILLTPENSGLPGKSVRTILQTNSGWWFGTNNGVAFWDGEKSWKSYQAGDMGLGSGQVNSLAMGSQGEIWVGTQEGAVVGIEGKWKVYTKANSGLPDNAVFSIAVQPGTAAWFGTLKGLSRLDLMTNEWQNIQWANVGFGTGIVNIYIDSRNNVWVASVGSGLGMWDGKAWTNFRVSDSDIPQNNVTLISEIKPGIYWMGFNFSTEPGGVMASFDGKDWKEFNANNSGYNGGEPTSLTFDSKGRIWIGTAVNGLVTYQFTQ